MTKIDLIIDALEKYIAFTPSFYDVGKEALDAARELKALKPVAWITPDGEGFRMRLEPPVDDVPLGWKALYTAPPSKEWVGLTDAELAEFSAMKLGAYDLCLEVEAKLEERNT